MGACECHGNGGCKCNPKPIGNLENKVSNSSKSEKNIGGKDLARVGIVAAFGIGMIFEAKDFDSKVKNEYITSQSTKYPMTDKQYKNEINRVDNGYFLGTGLILFSAIYLGYKINSTIKKIKGPTNSISDDMSEMKKDIYPLNQFGNEYKDD